VSTGEEWSVHSVDVRREFGPERGAAVDARAFAVGALPPSSDVAERVALLVSELAANAILHARSQFSVRMLVEPSRVRIEVTDQGPGVPVRRNYGKDAITGRGLTIVESMSDRWGSDQLEESTIVWCEVDL
jgi:anti-sigma regulatory factor (Ser/Thr protein kinase)